MSERHKGSSDQRTRTRLRELVPWALCAALCGASAGCKEASAAELIKEKSTLPESTREGTVHFNVKSDGDARVVVTDDKGNVVKQDVTGQLTFKPDASGDAQTLELKLDPETGVLRANGPDLGRGLTEVRYALRFNGKARTGALHLPESGTKGLRDSADAAEKVTEPGPHGGTVQIIGKKRYEVLADSRSGQARVYLLDTGEERPKQIKLALDADDPSLVELHWEADGYYLADLGVHRVPRAATLVVVDEDEDTHVVLVGYRPGIAIVLDARPVFWVERGWEPPGLARGHYKGTVYGPPGQYRREDDDEHEHEREKVMIKSNGGGEKVHLKFR